MSPLVCGCLRDEAGNHHAHHDYMHNVRDEQQIVDELIYLLYKYILSEPNSLPSNMYHAKVLIEKVGHNHESIYTCKMDVCCSKRMHTKI
jgi:hypothetical protein